MVPTNGSSRACSPSRRFRSSKQCRKYCSSDRIVEERLDIFVVVRLDRAVDAVPFGKADPDVLRLFQFVVAPALLAGGGARPDADQVDRAVARIVIGVAEEIFRRELPVGREHPFVDADHLGAALAAVAAIQRLVEMDFGVAEIGDEIGRVLVPGRPDRALVDCAASPPRPASWPRGRARRRTASGTAARPAACRRWCRSSYDRAGEDRGIALLVTAHLHAAMPA